MRKKRVVWPVGILPAGCPDIADHTASPNGYVAWHEWAEKMSSTHRQKRCPTCGFYSIWIPKETGHGE